jgi:hypothetical protein
MASSTPTPSGSSNPSPRWPRSGPEPGSAFNGISRGGRGRGGGRGGRGGGGRPNTASRDNKSPGETRPPKGAPQEKSGPTQPSKISAPSAGPSAAEKPSIPNPTKPKPSSRKSSHNIPSVVVASPGADVSSASSPKSQNRRRRSQTIKGSGLQKINPPAADDNLLRPMRPRLPTVPHTAPIKDTPPHLSNNNFDMRNNIDALVERVRAVAMAENRPSTPGSHIDWAGDDDDSLPDLDDWGVSTSSQSTHPAEMISPIIVDGLRPLPEPTSEPLTPPISRFEVVSPSQPILGHKPAESDSSPASTPFTPTGLFNEESKRLDFHSTSVPDPLPKATPPSINARGTDTIKTSLHHSLPPKPVTSAPNARAKLVGNNTRGPTVPAPSAKEASVVPKPTATAPKNLTLVNAGSKAESSEPLLKEAVNETPITTTTNNIPDIKEDVIDEGVAESIHASSSTEDFSISRKDSDLSASIHAPQALVDSLSAPAGLSSYTETSHGSRNSSYGHTRAHTVGRPPSFPRSPPGEYVPRFSRSGQNTPRGGGGGYQENSHFRTHSTPPAGVGLNNYRTPHSRPVITGDAISKLARTIGTSNGSPLNRPIITGEAISRLARSIDGSKQTTIAASNE